MSKGNLFKLSGSVLCLLILEVVLTSSAVAQSEAVSKEDVNSIRIIKGPYLQNVQKTAITIMWETGCEATSRVDYGKEKAYSKKIVSEKLEKIHEITISGLEEETIYHYQVSSNVPSEQAEKVRTIASEDNIFKTAVKDNTPFCFAVWGDNRTDAKTHKRIIDVIVERRPDIVINVGDVVTKGDNYEEWGREFFEPAKELFKNTPFYIAIGNHEYYDKDYKYTPGKRCEWFHRFVSCPPHDNYCSFDYGNAHFVILDVNKFAYNIGPTDCHPGSVQYKWLEEDMRSSDATWKFVFWHPPPYCSGDYAVPKMRELCPLLEKYGVDVVFNGHAHVYERSYPLRGNRIDMKDGIVYIVSGGGGCGLTNLGEKRSFWTAEAVSRHHYCLVKIAEKNFEMIVYDIDGKVLDLLTISK